MSQVVNTTQKDFIELTCYDRVKSLKELEDQVPLSYVECFLFCYFIYSVLGLQFGCMNLQTKIHLCKDVVTLHEMWTNYEQMVGLVYNSKGRSTFYEEAKFASLLSNADMPLLRSICSYELGKPIPKVCEFF